MQSSTCFFIQLLPPSAFMSQSQHKTMKIFPYLGLGGSVETGRSAMKGRRVLSHPRKIQYDASIRAAPIPMPPSRTVPRRGTGSCSRPVGTASCCSLILAAVSQRTRSRDRARDGQSIFAEQSSPTLAKRHHSAGFATQESSARTPRPSLPPCRVCVSTQSGDKQLNRSSKTSLVEGGPCHVQIAPRPWTAASPPLTMFPPPHPGRPMCLPYWRRAPRDPVTLGDGVLHTASRMHKKLCKPQDDISQNNTDQERNCGLGNIAVQPESHESRQPCHASGSHHQKDFRWSSDSQAVITRFAVKQDKSKK
ncbi:hypothetical protein VTI74DRAFT_11353 [Chaetomium olivicolor]